MSRLIHDCRYISRSLPKFSFLSGFLDLVAAMKGLVTLILASAVANAAAVPFDHSTSSLQKRQSKGAGKGTAKGTTPPKNSGGLGGLAALLGGGAGGGALGGLLAASSNPAAMGKYMGEPEASE